MALRQVLRNFIMPGLEKDLSKAIGKEVAKVPAMMDCMVAPSVYAFEPIGNSASSAAGAFGRSMHAASPVRMVKVEYPAPEKGLFY